MWQSKNMNRTLQPKIGETLRSQALPAQWSLFKGCPWRLPEPYCSKKVAIWELPAVGPEMAKVLICLWNFDSLADLGARAGTAPQAWAGWAATPGLEAI